MPKEKTVLKDQKDTEEDFYEQSEGKKETFVDVICRNIRRDIIVGELKPGMKVLSKDLAERYGTSETPVKLALNRLISEQVVENYPRQGMIIKPISLSDAEETFALRQMMDLFYTKEIIDAVRINKALKKELENNIKEHEEVMNKYIINYDVELFVKDYNYDYEFHRLYLKCSGNQKIVDMYHRINPFMYANYIFSQQSKEKDLAGLNEHKAILNAIIKGDEELLKESIITHMTNAVNSIRIIMKCERIR